MIPDIVPVNTWAGNDSTTTFDFDFLINSDSELKVLHTDKNEFQTTLKLNIDYSISQVGNKNGSFIVFPLEGSEYSVLKTGEKITLMLDIPIAQTMPFGTSAVLNLNSLETALDYIVRLIQIVDRKTERSVKVMEGSDKTPDEFLQSLEESEANALLYSQNAANSANESSNSASNSSDSAELSKQWATSSTKIENLDYSSKYYAQQSKSSANTATEQATIATNKANNSASLNTEITNKYNSYVTNLENKTNTSIETLNTKTNEHVSTLNSTTNTNINKINTTVNNGMSDLANASNALRQTQITNCLLEVPEKIKYTLQNGVLTLKSGSEIVIPNGFESNGTTRKFDKVTISSDMTFAYGGKAENLVVCATASGQFFSTIMTYAVSDSLEPTVGANRVIWYDSINNIVKTNTSGGSWTTGLSFPLFVLDLTDGKVTNLKNVFNGFGVIGHYTFSYEGIKSLIPNGRNLDGTLKNVETITTSINVRDEAGKGSWIGFWDGTNILSYGVNNYFEQDAQPSFSGQHCMWLNTKENIFYTTSDGGVTWTAQPRMYLGVLRKTSASGDFVEASFKTPVELVKKGDIEKNLVEVKAYITETYVNGSSGYNIWSNKYCEQWGITEEIASGATVTISLLKSYKDTEYIILTESKGEYQATGQANDSVETVTSSSFTIHSGMTRACRKIWKTSGFLA